MKTTPQQYEALVLQDSPDAAIITSLQGDILHWGRGAERVFGYSSEEAVGQRLDELVVPLNRTEEAGLRATALSSGTTAFETILRRKDGTLVYVDISRTVVRQDGAAEPVVLLTKKDVTFR